MQAVKAVVFDFIGTLAIVEDYSYENSEEKLYQSLCKAGFDVERAGFIKAYENAHQKYRTIRYRELLEVTNAVWISEALNMLGLKTTPKNENIRMAVSLFFEDYIRSLKLRPHATKVLENLAASFDLGLVSNFTYAAVVHAGLEKLGIRHYFSVVLVSHDFGWRKPSLRVFREVLKRLGVVAGEAVYVGDSPEEDIRGAQNVGMKTIFIPSQFYDLTDLEGAAVRPDFKITALDEIPELLLQFQDGT